MTTPTEIAFWMFEELKRQGYLYQHTVEYDISVKYGKAFTHINNSGNLAINQEVLKEFRRITTDLVVWGRHERCWRFREDYDDPSKRLVE